MQQDVLLLTDRLDTPTRASRWKRFAWIGFDLIVFAGIILFLG